jgi:hypothetical protein
LGGPIPPENDYRYSTLPVLLINLPVPWEERGVFMAYKAAEIALVMAASYWI